MVGILLLIFALLINVALHEFGHMIVAKHFGLKVPTYAIGMGPTLWRHERNGTTYHIKLLPLGGFCDIKELGDTDEDNPAKWSYILVVLAGVFFNFIVFLVSIYFSCVIILHNPVPVVISDVTPTATEAGFQKGDIIKTFNGDADVLGAMKAQGRKGEGTFLIQRENEEFTVKVNFDNYKDGLIGIDVKGGKWKEDTNALTMTGLYIKEYFGIIPETFTYMKDSVVKTYDFDSEYSAENGMTIVAAAALLKDGYTRFGITLTGALCNLTAGIAFSLFFFNLLPIPCLDGGRAIIYLIELLSAHKVRQKHVAKLIKGSFVILTASMLVTMIVEAIRI